MLSEPQGLCQFGYRPHVRARSHWPTPAALTAILRGVKLSPCVRIVEEWWCGAPAGSAWRVERRGGLSGALVGSRIAQVGECRDDDHGTTVLVASAHPPLTPAERDGLAAALAAR